MKFKNSKFFIVQILLGTFIVILPLISAYCDELKNKNSKTETEAINKDFSDLNTWTGEQIALILKYPKCWKIYDHMVVANDAFQIMPTEKCNDKRKWKIDFGYPEWGGNNNPKIKKSPKVVTETINGEKIEFTQYIYSGKESIGDRSWTAEILCQGKKLHPSYLDYPSLEAKYTQRKENEVPPIFIEFIKRFKCL